MYFPTHPFLFQVITIIRGSNESDNVDQSLTSRDHIEIWKDCMKSDRKPNMTINYKLLEIGIFGSYETSSDSSSDRDPYFLYSFQ